MVKKHEDYCPHDDHGKHDPCPEHHSYHHGYDEDCKKHPKHGHSHKNKHDHHHHEKLDDSVSVDDWSEVPKENCGVAGIDLECPDKIKDITRAIQGVMAGVASFREEADVGPIAIEQVEVLATPYAIRKYEGNNETIFTLKPVQFYCMASADDPEEDGHGVVRDCLGRSWVAQIRNTLVEELPDLDAVRCYKGDAKILSVCNPFPVQYIQSLSLIHI